MENGRYVEEMTQSDAERESTKMDRKKKMKESRENTMRSPDKASRVSKEKTQDPEDGQSVNRTENSVHSEKKSRPPVKSSNPSKETAKKAQQSKETPKKSKELARASKEPMKKSKEKEVPSKPSVTKSPKTNQRKQTKEKLSKEKDNKGEDEPAAEHQSKERPPPLDFEELQLVCRNSNPVKYNTDHYQQQLQKMIENNNKNSLLSVSDHVIRFRQSSYMESCFHLDIHNPTGKHVLFRVERPKVPYLSVKPKIGFLAPGDSRTIYLLFSFRCPRLPDDLAFSYIIYQIPIKKSDLPPLEHDKKNYTTKKTRKLAKDATFEHRWTVGVAFYAGEGETDICPGPHLEGNPPQLDNKGKIFQDDYNPDEHDDKSENLPSACD